MSDARPQQGHPADDFTQDNGQFSDRSTGSGGASNQHASELQFLRHNVNQLEERCLLLEDIAHECQSMLENQAEESIKRNWRMKQNEEKFDQQIKAKDAKMGDMALHVHTRDQHVIALKDEVRRLQRDLQNYHHKHKAFEHALKQERESVKDRERAALDIRHMSSSGSYSGAATAATGEPRGDLGRRTLSSGSFFAKGTAGGPGAGATNGAAGGGRGAGTPDVQID